MSTNRDIAMLAASSSTTRVIENESTSFMTTTMTTASNLDEPSTSRYDQCDYNLLFSHLPASFAHLSQIQLSQLSLHVVGPNTFVSGGGGGGAGSTSLPPIVATDQHAVQKLCYALVALCFGLFYSLIGYRFLKLSAFIIGFALGSSIIYMILAEQKQLTVVENLIISLSIGCLFAFVALLVQYIGLFLLGITASISLVTCILILIDLFHTNQSAWLCILLMFTCATLVASITLKFQKSLTIFNTSAIGAGLLLFAVDYFVENNLLIDYIFELYRVNGNAFNIFERQKALLKPSSSGGGDSSKTTTTIPRLLSPTVVPPKISLANITSINNKAANSTETTTTNSNSALALFLHLYSSAHARLCWYTWLIFGIYFVFLISSILVQYCITGKNYDHRDSWQKLIRGSRKKRSANLEKIRLKSHVNHDSSADHNHSESRHHHHHHHSRHHHHHHHHNHHSKSTPPPHQSTGSNTGTSSGTNTDRLSLSAQSIDSQNDTLLLVTNELHNHREYAAKSSRHKSSSSKQQQPAKIVKQHHVKSSKSGGGSKNSAADLQIVSFEVVKSPKKEKELKVHAKNENSNKTNPSNNIALPAQNVNNKSKSAQQQQQQQQQSSSISTTTSATSSASSTCQLIPVHLVLDPSAPPAPSSSSSSSSSPDNHQQQQQQQPPPVPSQPPPKLPPMFAAAAVVATSTMTSNGGTVTSLQASMAKMKQHRSSNSGSTKKSDSSGDKFRHFYQIRRNNGDVLSQDFMNNFHSTKIQSTSNLNTNESASSANDNNSGAPLTSSLNSSDSNKKKRRSLSSKSKS